jgi:hypothetical protein
MGCSSLAACLSSSLTRKALAVLRGGRRIVRKANGPPDASESGSAEAIQDAEGAAKRNPGLEIFAAFFFSRNGARLSSKHAKLSLTPLRGGVDYSVAVICLARPEGTSRWDA